MQVSNDNQDKSCQVYDSQTGRLVGTYKSHRSAITVCLRRNLEYGACRYTVNGIAY